MQPRPLIRTIHVAFGIFLGQAWRAVFRHKVRSTLSALGIAIGIAAVVWVVALATAGAERSAEQLRALGDNLVWVEAGSRNVNGVRTGTHGATSLTLEDAEAIAREVPLVARLSPQMDGSVVAVNGTQNWTTRFRGIAADYLPIKRWEVVRGSVFTEEQLEHASNVCLLGATVRDRLFGAEDPTGQVIRLSGQPFEVVGVLGAKGQSATGQDQDDTIMMPYTTAQKKLRGNRLYWLDDIVCSAKSPEGVAPATEQIIALMRQRHHIDGDREDDFNIRHPEEIVKAQLEAATALSLLLISIASVSLVVGGIGIMNVMLASVAERTREIGVRLAVGATELALQSQFLAEAIILGLAGGVLGVGLSVAGSSLIGKALGWPMAIPIQALGLAVVFSIGVGALFGFLPARRASKLDPIAALRDE